MRMKWLPGVIVGLVALTAGLVFVIGRSESMPVGPQPVIWDKTPCAECRMSVSERGFAVQLQARDGQVFDFDDVGCLFNYLEKNQPAVHAIYIHHLREDRWLSPDDVAFIEARPSPMAYNLGAVDRGAAGALTFDEARARLRQGRRGGHVPR